MRGSWTPSIVPKGHDQTFYLLINNYGQSGAAFAETDLETVQFHFARTLLLRLKPDNQTRPAPKLNRPINDKAFSLLDCFGIVGANQRFEADKTPVKPNGICSVFCHRRGPALNVS
jgi:hypothetical protein